MAALAAERTAVLREATLAAERTAVLREATLEIKMDSVELVLAIVHCLRFPLDCHKTCRY